MSHDTVQALLDAGEITPRTRTTVDDLWFAVTWLEAYEGDPAEDSNMTAAATVARYLVREAKRREAKRRERPSEPS